MLHLKPSEIRYSQDSIAPRFGLRTCHSNKRIGETLDDLLQKRTTLDDIPKITVCCHNGLTFTSDNRRLWVFKKLEELGECEGINVYTGYIQPYKFTTVSSGTSIQVRGDPGGTVWRTWNRAKMNAKAPPSGSLRYRDDILSREGIGNTYDQLYKKIGALSLAGKAQLGPSQRVPRQVSVIKLTPKDVGFCQKRIVIYGKNMGERLDELLLSKSAMISCSLDVFEYNDCYYTEDCEELWVFKTLEKFGKKIDIRGTVRDKPFDSTRGLSLFSLSDSLKTSTSIGGVHWKKLENISNLPTLENKSVPVSDIFFTVTAIPDVYEKDSIAKVLVHSFSTMTIPRRLRVIEYNGSFYALDNEILSVVKESEKIKGSLEVNVAVKMQMDRILFSSFTSEKIKKVDIIRTSNRHTDEEDFIIRYIGKVSA